MKAKLLDIFPNNGDQHLEELNVFLSMVNLIKIVPMGIANYGIEPLQTYYPILILYEEIEIKEKE